MYIFALLQGGQDGNDKAGTRQNSSMKILPFEFVALEACLEAVCSALENEVRVSVCVVLFVCCLIVFSRLV